MDLFDYSMKQNATHAPLADRMRPTSLKDFFGQQHIVGPNSLLNRAIISDKLGSCIFWGPPGVGKTTLAKIIANTTASYFEELNAVSSTVADARKIISESIQRLKLYGKKTYLLLDECHRWNKAQSDSVLPAIEKGEIIFIGSTTENPYVSMTPAIVSRCRIFEFKRLSKDDIVQVLKRAVADKERGYGNLNLSVDEAAYQHLAFVAGGDVRTALNALELAVLTTKPNADGNIIIDKSVAEQSIQKKSLSVDESLYYDMLSAFCKSLRGSDADAALYWSARLIEAGCDPMLIARRLVVHSAEDVGMADPEALKIATSAMYALEKIGYPEARIPLAEAIIYVCHSEKSNSVLMAIEKATQDALTVRDDTVPPHLRDMHYKGSENRSGKYLYPHDYGGYIPQQYLPDQLKDRQYYVPSHNGYEKQIRLKKWQKNDQ